MKYGIIAIALALVIGLFAGASVLAQPTVADLEGDLMCACGDCIDVLANCDCEFSDNMRLVIAEKIDQGQTEQDRRIDQGGNRLPANRADHASVGHVPAKYFLQASALLAGHQEA